MEGGMSGSYVYTPPKRKLRYTAGAFGTDDDKETIGPADLIGDGRICTRDEVERLTNIKRKRFISTYLNPFDTVLPDIQIAST